MASQIIVKFSLPVNKKKFSAGRLCGFYRARKYQCRLNIVQEILKFQDLCSLHINNLHVRGKSYDGALVMAGKVSCVSSQILQKQLKALYCHCRGHNFNLFISSICSRVHEIRNFYLVW